MGKPALQFPNPVLQALQTAQSAFALRAQRALKYPRRVTPFSTLLDDSPEALADLFTLFEPGEESWVVLPALPRDLRGFLGKDPIGVVQMTWPADAPLPPLEVPEGVQIEPLTCANAGEMVALTDVAFPGFFRIDTCQMGQYYGIREGGENTGKLIAMAGERMAAQDPTTLESFKEISGVCTHPDHRGKGYAQLLMTRLLHDHRSAGYRSYLHASEFNTFAIDLYTRMGFDHRGQFPMCRLQRPK